MISTSQWVSNSIGGSQNIKPKMRFAVRRPCLRGFQPGLTQTGLWSIMKQLEACYKRKVKVDNDQEMAQI